MEQFVVDGRDPQSLLHAAQHGRSDVIHRRCRPDGNVNPDQEVDKNGLTALHYAAGRGDLGIVVALLELSAGVDTRNKDTRTPLMWAARNGHMEVCEELVKRGADVRAANKLGICCLHWAAWGGSLDAVAFLLEKEADINSVCHAGCNLAVWAATAGSYEMCVWLHEKRADFASTNKNGHGVLNKIAWRGHSEKLAGWMLNLDGVEAQLFARDWENELPLDRARQQGHTQLAEWLHQEMCQRRLRQNVALVVYVSSKHYAARQLVRPKVTLQKDGEFEGGEFWEAHEELLKRAWQEHGPLHADLYNFGPVFERRYLSPKLRAAVRLAREEGREEALQGLFEEILPGVFASEDLFTAAFRKDFLEELERINSAGIPTRRPNGMNRYGVILDQVGFEKALNGLVDTYIKPLGGMLFPELVGAHDADEHYAFTVKYEPTGDTELAKHGDASVVTLNLCLGPTRWEGGALRFFDSGGSGIYALPKGNASAGSGDVNFRPGQVLIHRGQHKHQALPLLTGQRTESRILVVSGGQLAAVMSVVCASIAEPAWKVSQISTSTCDGEEVEESMGRAITGSTDCSEDSTSRHQRLWARALDSRWKLSRTDFKVKKELSRTLKSTLYQASWQGVDVVVKCAGLHDDDMARQLRSNEGLLRSSGLRSDADQEDRAISDELLHEIDLLSSLRHPDLVMFLGACIEPHMPIMCVTEFLPGGDLERYFVTQRNKHDSAIWRPALPQVIQWSSAIGRALSFLHDRDVVHRDLKPLNLLLTKHLEIKVSDFGISRLMARECDGYSMTGGIGSYRYMAPEVVRYQAYDQKVDIYAYGLIMYFMSSGRTPFHQLGSDPEVILQQYQRGKEPRPVLLDCP
ncbi:unnamed protein product, partial [Symbiodinium microadriaticum]